MERKKLAGLVALILVIFLMAGCETVPKKFKAEVAGIKTRVEALESKVEGVETKQAESERASGEQSQAIEDLKESARQKMAAAKTNIEIKPRIKYSKAWVRDIQTCLKNAGFYTGKIDGVKGRKTRKAIREFQRSNGLRADGVVGRKTWELLSKYSSGTARAAMGEMEEGATK